MMNKKAVVLLSGGLDSTVALYAAMKRGYKCFCLVFDYGQRHSREIKSAKAIARAANCELKILKIALPWKSSALLDKGMVIPEADKRKAAKPDNIPSTYVPARNIIFLSFALSFAEAIKAGAIFIGAHQQDYSGYPDCRKEFYQAFTKAAKAGTKTGVENKGIRINTPLINKNKAQIIKMGARMGVPFRLTWSCYKGGRKPCGSCESCYYREKGFKEAGIPDR